METLTIYRNKPEVFKCELQVEGASLEDAIVKLCLEFEDNKNMYFYGSLDKDGVCSVSIPKLIEVTKSDGNLIIEAIIDNTYFKVYEANVKLKNSVDVKMKPKSTGKVKEQKEVEVRMGKILKEEFVKQPIVEEIIKQPEPIDVKPTESIEEVIEQPTVDEVSDETISQKSAGLWNFKEWKQFRSSI